MNTDVEEGKKFTRSLPVPLTEHEKAAKLEKAGKIRKATDKLEAELKAEVAERKKKIAEKKAEEASILADGERGTEDRKIECVERRDFRARRAVIVRLDTEEEIESRALSAEEIKQAIKPVEGPAPDNVVDLASKKGKKGKKTASSSDGDGAA